MINSSFPRRHGFLACLLLVDAITAVPSYGDDSLLHADPLDFCKVAIIDEVSVPAEQQGVLEDLNVREGMQVEKGALLGSIDSTEAELLVKKARHDYEAAYKQAKNELSVWAAEKAQKVAQAEYDSSMEANQRSPGTITETEVRRKLLQAERAGMQIELAVHELEVASLQAQSKHNELMLAEAALKKRQIISRINGVVVKLYKHAGDWVTPGEPVMRIVRMDQLRVEGEIDGTRYARHEVVGRPVDIEVTLTGGGKEKLQGTVVFASPLVESNEYTIRAEVDNRKLNGKWLLTPGLNARMRLLDSPLAATEH